MLPVAGTFAAALVLAAVTAAFPWQPAAAQAAVPCTAIADDAERLACYDRALRAPQAVAPPPAAPAAQSAAPPTARAPATSASQAVPTAAPAAAVPAAATPSAATATAAAPAAAAADEIIAIIVVGVRTQPGRETTFTTQDGTTWVQTDSQRVVGLPDTPFEAELKPGAMGSRFLVPVGRGRAVRVRALEP